MEETAEGRVFLTVYVPAPQLVITGAVHISQALAPIGKMLGYDVTIVDPRTAFASPERFPDVKVIAEWPDKALPPLNVDRYTAFVALTHDPKIDDPALLHALSSATASISARSARERRTRAASSGSSSRVLPTPILPASMRRSGSTSARYRRPRSRSPSWRRSPNGCARKPTPSRAHKGRVMKFGAGGAKGRARRDRRAYHPAGRAGAQERHADRACRRSPRSKPPASRTSWWRGSSRATFPKTSPPPRSPKRSPARACMSIAPLPAAPICSRKSRACWSSTRTLSTGSTASTRRSRSRRCRPTSRWSPAR